MQLTPPDVLKHHLHCHVRGSKSVNFGHIRDAAWTAEHLLPNSRVNQSDAVTVTVALEKLLFLSLS